MNIVAQNARLIEEHLLPMMVIQDRNTGEIVSQVFNFIDLMGGKQQLTLESKFILKLKRRSNPERPP